MFLLLVGSSVLIKPLCFLLQWVRLLQCIHPSPYFQLPWDPTSYLPTDKHLIIYQTWIGAVFLFLGSLPQECHNPFSDENSCSCWEKFRLWPQHSLRCSLLKRFFLVHLTCFSTGLNGSDFAIQQTPDQQQLSLSDKMRFFTWGPPFGSRPLSILDGWLWPAMGCRRILPDLGTAPCPMLAKTVELPGEVGRTICWLLSRQKTILGTGERGFWRW